MSLDLPLRRARRTSIVGPLPMLAWRNRQTRTAQDRMGKPVEVRVLSRAVSPPQFDLE